jgi:hypothetical protein
MKIAELFKEAVGDTSTADDSSKDTKSFVQQVLANRKGAAKEGKKAKKAAESEESEEEAPPTSMSEAFRRFADKSRDTDIEERRTKKKKKKVSVTDEEDSDEIKISVPKSHEAKKKKPKASEESDESEDQGEEEEQEAPPKKKKAAPVEDEAEEEQEDEQTEEESDDDKLAKRLLAIDPDSLVSATGQPISKKAADNIRELKKHLDYFAKKAKKLEQTIPDYDPRIKHNYEQIKTAHDELKKKFTDRFFEETPEWEETFVAPVKAASIEMAKWLKSHDHEDNEEVQGEMELHRKKLEDALIKGDDVVFYEHVDALAEFLKKGAGTRFRSAAPLLWDAFQKKEEAYKDKDAARKKVRDASMNLIEEESKRAHKEIDNTISAFEKKNAQVIEAYRTNPRLAEYMDYDNTVTVPIQDAKDHIAQMLKTRKVSPAITELVVKGALFNLKQKEHEGFQERIRLLEEENRRLEGKLTQKDKVIDKVRPSRSAVTESDDDDDDDEDEPKSFAEHFRRKRAAGLV